MALLTRATLTVSASIVAAALLAASCTFPSVDYEPPCDVPSACDKDVDSCAKQASLQRDTCLAKCKGGMVETCEDACRSDYHAALSACLAQCEDCSLQQGCANSTQSCKRKLGLP
jgi:hypothetical protein